MLSYLQQQLLLLKQYYVDCIKHLVLPRDRMPFVLRFCNIAQQTSVREVGQGKQPDAVRRTTPIALACYKHNASFRQLHGGLLYEGLGQCLPLWNVWW